MIGMNFLDPLLEFEALINSKGLDQIIYTSGMHLTLAPSVYKEKQNWIDIEHLAASKGQSPKYPEDHPEWKHDFQNKLLKVSKSIYERTVVKFDFCILYMDRGGHNQMVSNLIERINFLVTNVKAAYPDYETSNIDFYLNQARNHFLNTLKLLQPVQDARQQSPVNISEDFIKQINDIHLLMFSEHQPVSDEDALKFMKAAILNKSTNVGTKKLGFKPKKA